MRQSPATATVLLALASGIGLSACVSTQAAPAEIEVIELDGPFTPLGIEVTGLPAGKTVTFTADVVLGAARYSSEASFRVGDNGAIDLAADAPESGDWVGADAMAPFWSMIGPGSTRWQAWDEPFEVELAVVDDQGDELAQTTVTRPGMAAGIEARAIDEPSIEGVYAIPADMSADSGPGSPKPAVLVFSGSDGGLEYAALTARWLAGLGYPALAISYFGGEGQPAELENVPVETFEAALAWLREQPEVDVENVTSFGVSRGGEMALWLAAEHPDLLAGAIAPVGAGTIVCGYPQGVAWTRGGAALSTDCAMSVVGSPTTQIDVAAIDGPVVLACGTDDELWDSCAALDDIVERRDGAGLDTLATRGVTALHAVAWAPYLPLRFGDEAEPEQIAATRAVQKEFWGDVLALLAD